MVQIAKETDVYTRNQYLKQQLQVRYGDRIFLADMNGKSDVVCFKNVAKNVATSTGDYIGRRVHTEVDAKEEHVGRPHGDDDKRIDHGGELEVVMEQTVEPDVPGKNDTESMDEEHIIQEQHQQQQNDEQMQQKQHQQVVLPKNGRAEYDQDQPMENKIKKVYSAAQVLRQAILDSPMWTFTGSLTDYDEKFVPTELNSFFRWVIVGPNKKLSNEREKLVKQKISRLSNKTISLCLTDRPP